MDFGSLTNIYSASSAAKAAKQPDFTFDTSTPIGYGGYTALLPTRAKGTPFGPGTLEQAYGAPYQYIGQGSQQAENLLREGFLSRYRTRVQGYAAGRAEESRRLAADAAASGYSPELLRRQEFARQAEDQSVYGQERGDMEAAYAEAAAELRKNTGVELAALSESQRTELLENYLNYKARAAARKAGKNALWGAGIEAVGNLAGGFIGGGGGGGAYGAGVESGGLTGYGERERF